MSARGAPAVLPPCSNAGPLSAAASGRDGTPERHRTYAAAMRAEYAYAPEERFNAGRRAFLSLMLGRERIYALAPFRERFEARARLSMADELRGLERPGA